MATLPERKPCSMCGNLTRFTLDNGTPECQKCNEHFKAISVYAVRMPAPCAAPMCFDSARPGMSDFCKYHEPR